MSLLDAVILDDRTRPPQMSGPQAGKVLRISGTKLVVTLDAFPAQEFACTWGRVLDHQHTDADGPTGYAGGSFPTAGTRCLVLFVGQGLADPWVVAVDGFAS